MNRNLLVAAMLAPASLLAAAESVSPYISRVFEYRPAPGQFVNVLPAYEEGDDEEQMTAKAAEQLVGEQTPGMITLGAWGGYVVFGFDHTVANKAGVPDFKVYGNATPGGAEPGIVMVSRDENANGLPDDLWYELRGSAHDDAATRMGYCLTYHAPDADNTDDSTYIRWTSNQPTDEEGYVQKNTFHRQSYWPLWLADEATLEYEGTCLPDNYSDQSGVGTNFVLTPFDWGYADNLPLAQDSGFDIGNAIDGSGRAVHLEGIDFVKVYTGVNQTCGWLGETSTEVRGAEDLHPDMTVSAARIEHECPVLVLHRGADYAEVRCAAERMEYSLYTPDGRLIGRGVLGVGTQRLSMPGAGIAILVTAAGTLKL